MKSKKELDQVQENSLDSNPAGRSADRELGDKGGKNQNAKDHQQVPRSSQAD